MRRRRKPRPDWTAERAERLRALVEGERCTPHDDPELAVLLNAAGMGFIEFLCKRIEFCRRRAIISAWSGSAFKLPSAEPTSAQRSGALSDYG